MEEAGVLVTECPFVEETHPDAHAAWLTALSMYYENKGEDEAARQCIESAHQIAPDNPKIKALWREWQR